MHDRQNKTERQGLLVVGFGDGYSGTAMYSHSKANACDHGQKPSQSLALSPFFHLPPHKHTHTHKLTTITCTGHACTGEVKKQKRTTESGDRCCKTDQSQLLGLVSSKLGPLLDLFFHYETKLLADQLHKTTQDTVN